jgi:hypothetical protein
VFLLGVVKGRHRRAIIFPPLRRVGKKTRRAAKWKAAFHEPQRLRPDAAVVRHCAQAAGSFEGMAFRVDHKCVLICEKQAGEWRIVWEQPSFNEASDQSRSHCVIHSRRMTLPKT